MKVADVMQLGIVPQDNLLFAQEENLLVDEDDDDQSYSFSRLSTSSQPQNPQRQQSRTQASEFDAFSAEREITNFQTQTNNHFQTCKFLRVHLILPGIKN